MAFLGQPARLDLCVVPHAKMKATKSPIVHGKPTSGRLRSKIVRLVGIEQ